MRARSAYICVYASCARPTVPCRCRQCHDNNVRKCATMLFMHIMCQSKAIFNFPTTVVMAVLLGRMQEPHVIRRLNMYRRVFCACVRDAYVGGFHLKASRHNVLVHNVSIACTPPYEYCNLGHLKPTPYAFFRKLCGSHVVCRSRRGAFCCGVYRRRSNWTWANIRLAISYAHDRQGKARLSVSCACVFVH